MKDTSKGTAGGSKGKHEGKNPKNRPNKGAKKPAASSGKKEDDKEGNKTMYQDPYKFELDIKKRFVNCLRAQDRNKQRSIPFCHNQNKDLE